MKKIKILLILFISIFIFNMKVFAGANLSVSTNSVTKGGTFTVSVNMSSAAAWNIHVSASGPVSGCTINQADATADAMDTNKTFTATCTATDVGTINVSLSGDVTSANDGIAVMLSGSASINVTEPSPAPTPTPQPAPQPQQPQNNLSTNNNIGSLTVDGYELKKVDNNNYTLTVGNNVTSLNVNASAEDSKATVTGTGKHELNVGENNIEVIVTAESGWQNKITIKVTRKDGYYLEDLDTLLKDKENNDVIINTDSKITKENLDKIKDSGKQVNFNYYSEDKKLIYSWILDGSKIDKSNEIITTITNESEEIKNISKLSNYADGLYINFEHSGKLPQGTKIKLYVGDKFEDGNVVNIYHYVKEKNKLENVREDVNVQNGYIEFDVEHCSEYFVTMSNLNIVNKKSSINIFMILSIIEFVIIITLILIYFLKSNKTKNEESIQTLSDEYSEQININTNELVHNEIQSESQNELLYQEQSQDLSNIENKYINQNDKSDEYNIDAQEVQNEISKNNFN